MCGICGVALPSTTASPEAAAGEVRAMAAALSHRGPGERAVLSRGSSVLGAARLHVTAPDAPSGPYATLDGRVAATVNGEIWNHAELRAELAAAGVPVPPGPDTAVVAPLYAARGVAGLARLRGMFAAAIHDARTGETVLARDRFGIKPLYVTAGSAPRFASEPGALPAAGTIDREALRDYLVLGVVPAPRTLDLGIRKVPAGTALTIGPRGRRTDTFAPPPRPVRSASAHPDEVRAALSEAVRRHLMGDVPIGVYLSGGLDSAAVAALVREADAPLRTFAMTFPGQGAYDEGAAARRSAELLGARHVETAFRPGDLPALIEGCARHFGEPFGDSSALAVLALSRVAAQHVTVVLTGTGADELFLGYRRYGLGSLPPGTGAAARAAARFLPASRRGALGTAGALARKLAASCAAPDAASRYLERLAVVPPSWRERLLGEAAPAPVLSRVRAAFRDAPSFADGARAADLAVYLPDDLLAKEDRTTMACGLENRVPFLDDGVADLAGTLPAREHGRDKRLLRRALRGLLPGDIVRRRKHGFAVPVSEWLRGPSRGVVEDLLVDPAARVRDLLDPLALDALVAAHRTGDDGLGPAVYALVALEASLRHAG
jgi:asparagine synthase (glutamine-hydrolysing)